MFAILGSRPIERCLRISLLVLLILSLVGFLKTIKCAKSVWNISKIPPDSIRNDPLSSFCYSFKLDRELISRIDSKHEMFVLENLDRLPIPNSDINQIAVLGGGRFNCALDIAYFSSTENKDPRSTNKKYYLLFKGIRDLKRLMVWRYTTILLVSLMFVAAIMTFIPILMRINWQRRYRQFTEFDWISHVIVMGKGYFHELISRTKVFSEEAKKNIQLEGWCIFFLFLPPLGFALFSRNLFFDRPGFLDPFIYVGYFLHYNEHLPLFDHYYKISRLPWVLPGFFAYKIAGAVYGTYLLQIMTLFLGNLFLYQALKVTLKDKILALSVTLVYACCTQTQGSGGWNYHMTITNAYYFLSIWCLSNAFERSVYSFWLFAAGVGIACGIHTSLLQVIFLPLQIFHFACLTSSNKRCWSWRSVVVVFAGGLSITTFLGMINFISGGDFLFFLPQIHYTLSLSKGGNHWFVSPELWLGHADWLIYPVLILLGSILSLGTVLRQAKDRIPEAIMAASLLIQFILAAALMSYFDFVSHQTVLHPSYMAASIFGPAFLATGAIFHTFRARKSYPSVCTVGIIVSISTFVPLVFGGFSRLKGVIQSTFTKFPFVEHWPAVPVLILGICAVIWLIVLGRIRWAFVPSAIVLALVGSWGTDLRSYQLGEINGYRKELFAAYIKTDAHLVELDPTLLQIKFWFDEKEEVTIGNEMVPMGAAYNSCLACRGWLGNLLGSSPVPKIDDLVEKNIKGVSMIGILATEVNADRQLGAMQKRLAELGRISKVVDDTVIVSEPIRYRVIVMEISLAPGATGSHRSPDDSEKTFDPTGNQSGD